MRAAFAAALVCMALTFGGFVQQVEPYDPTGYVQAAIALHNGREMWTQYDAGPLALWPPLYSTLIAGGMVAGLTPLQAARWLNTLAMGAYVLLAWRLIDMHLTGRVRYAALLAACLSPMLAVSAELMSDALYAALVLAWFALLKPDASDKRLLALAAIAAAASLQRYVGVVLIGVGVVWYWRQAGAGRALVFAQVASWPLALWLARNWYLTGTLTGARGDFPPGYHVIAETPGTLALWAVYAGALALIVRLWTRGRGDAPSGTWWPLALYVVALVALNTGMAAVSWLNGTERLLSSAYVPLLLVIMGATWQAQRRNW